MSTIHNYRMMQAFYSYSGFHLHKYATRKSQNPQNIHSHGWICFALLTRHSLCDQNVDEGQMDQYLVYGEEYKTVRDAVAKAVVDCNVEQIEDVCEVF